MDIYCICSNTETAKTTIVIKVALLFAFFYQLCNWGKEKKLLFLLVIFESTFWILAGKARFERNIGHAWKLKNCSHIPMAKFSLEEDLMESDTCRYISIDYRATNHFELESKPNEFEKKTCAIICEKWVAPKFCSLRTWTNTNVTFT